MKKGDYGYMNQYKKKHLLGTAVYACIILALVITGKVTKDMVSAAAYIFAVLFVLPGAKQLIAFVVVAPYHSLEKPVIEDFDAHTRLLRNGMPLYDVTLASTESIAYVPYMYLFEKKLYCLIPDVAGKNKRESIREYIDTILQSAGISMNVISVQNASEMNRILEQLKDGAEVEESFLQKAKEQILIYNV